MKFIKGLILSLLGLILFSSLSAFGLAFTLRQTVLERDFLATEVSRLDVTGLLKEMFSRQIGQQLGQQVSLQFAQQIGLPIPVMADRMTAVLDATANELDPWTRQQLKSLAYNVYDYATAKSPTLNLQVPLATARDALKKNLRSAVTGAPELAAVPQGLKESAADSLAQSLLTQIPDTFDMGNTFGPGFRDGIAQARQYIGYFSLIYWGLLVLIVLCSFGIYALSSEVKAGIRTIGTSFLTYGIFEYATLVIIEFSTRTIPGLPEALQKGLGQLLSHLWEPLKTFSIAAGVIGLALVIISFIIRARKPPAPAAAN